MVDLLTPRASITDPGKKIDMSTSKETKTTGSRYRKAEDWVYGLGISDHDADALVSICDELRYMETQIVKDSRSIATSCSEFASRVFDFGVLHSRPTNYSRYQDLDAKIQMMEQKIKELFVVTGILLGPEGKNTLRSIISPKD